MREVVRSKNHVMKDLVYAVLVLVRSKIYLRSEKTSTGKLLGTKKGACFVCNLAMRDLPMFSHTFAVAI